MRNALANPLEFGTAGWQVPLSFPATARGPRWPRLGGELLAQEGEDVVRFGVAAEHRLRENEVAVDVDVEDSVDSGHHLDRTEAVFPLLENPRRQTGSVGERPSGNAVLDADVVAVGHRAHSLKCAESRAPRWRRSPRLQHLSEATSDLAKLRVDREQLRPVTRPGGSGRISFGRDEQRLRHRPGKPQGANRRPETPGRHNPSIPVLGKGSWGGRQGRPGTHWFRLRLAASLAPTG